MAAAGVARRAIDTAASRKGRPRRLTQASPSRPPSQRRPRHVCPWRAAAGLRLVQAMFCQAPERRYEQDENRGDEADVPATAHRAREGNRGTTLSPGRPAHTPSAGASDKPLPGLPPPYGPALPQVPPRSSRRQPSPSAPGCALRGRFEETPHNHLTPTAKRTRSGRVVGTNLPQS